MEIGFLAQVQLSHSVLPGMREHGWGRLVTVTGTSEPRFISAASPPKAGVHMWSRAISREIAADGVTINCIQSGKIRSEQIMREFPTPEIERDYASSEISMKRIGDVDEIASAALLLASAHAAYITGIVHLVDGVIPVLRLLTRESPGRGILTCHAPVMSPPAVSIHVNAEATHHSWCSIAAAAGVPAGLQASHETARIHNPQALRRRG